MSANPTIHRIAELAGVSIASVSRALNGKAGISDSLRQRILQLCAEQGYQPNSAARQLISGRNAVVGISMCAHSFSLRPYYNLLYQHLTLRLHKQGKVPISFSYADTPQLLQQAGAALILGHSPDDQRSAQISAAGIPAVNIGQQTSGFWVAADDRQGLYLACQHLLNQGRTRLCYVGDALCNAHNLRVQGYLQAINQAQLSPQQMLVPFHPSPSLMAYRVLQQHLQQGWDFDALVCETDEHALGCWEALQDAGIEVPRQVAITGFDDLPSFAEHLTTLRQDIAQLAEWSLQLLDEACQQQPARQLLLPMQLIVRQSSQAN